MWYAIINTMVIYGIFRKNKCVYVGQTRSKLYSRVSKYKSDVKFKRNTCMLIIRAMLKHGFDSFYFKVLDAANTLEELDRKEIAYISDLKPRYNVGLGGFYRKKISEKTRKRMSEANLRRQPHQFRTQPIYCLETGEWFCSVTEAGRKLGIGRRTICNAINLTRPDGTKYSVKGLHFVKD